MSLPPLWVLILTQVDAGAALAVTEADGGLPARMEIESFDSPPSGASIMSIEAFDSSPQTPDAGSSPGSVGVESFAAPAEEVSTQVFGFVRALGSVDTQFDSYRDDPLPENVAELRGRAHVGADIKLSRSLRVRLETRGVMRAVTQRGWYRAKATFEPQIGDAFVDWYTEAVDLRVGYQVVTFGANPAFAPADMLNPRDLRESLLLGEPEDTKLANFAARALLNVGKIRLTAAYFPVFMPHRYNVFGQDEGFLQPDLGINPRDTFRVDESIEDDIQPRVLETERPRHFPWFGDVGLKGNTEVGETTVGASWVFAHEKIPQVHLDPELQRVLADQSAGRPPNEAASLSVQSRFGAGERLARGFYQRHHVLSLEASRLVKTAQVDADFSWVPAQTLVDDRFNPVRKMTFTWVLGVSQAEDSDLLYNFTYIGMAIPDVPTDELLLILEPSTARGAPRTAFLHGLIGTVGYRFLDRKLEASVRFAVEYRGFAVAPKFTYAYSDKLSLILAAEIYEGRRYSPFGYFTRNDQVIVGAQWSIF